MVTVQLRCNGEGLWRAMLLPVTVQLAQTLARAAETLNLSDEVRVTPSQHAKKLDLRA